jgi:hypothetical protein
MSKELRETIQRDEQGGATLVIPTDIARAWSNREGVLATGNWQLPISEQQRPNRWLRNYQGSMTYRHLNMIAEN